MTIADLIDVMSAFPSVSYVVVDSCDELVCVEYGPGKYLSVDIVPRSECVDVLLKVKKSEEK